MTGTGGILIAAVSAIVIGLVLLVVTRIRDRARWREEIAGTLRGLGLEVHSVEPTVRASGSYRGLELAIDGTHTFVDGAAVFVTQITVTGGNPPATTVQRVGFGSTPATTKVLLTADPVFDARYRVYASSPAEPLWRDRARRELILALGRKVGELLELRCEEGRVSVTLRGVRLPPATLRAGVDLAYGMVA